MDLHAAIIEWIWVTVSSIGVVINTILFRATMLIHSKLRDDPTTTRPELLVAGAAVRQEALRLGKQMLIFVGGFAALFLAPPPPDLREVPQTIVALSTLIGVSFLMSLTSFFERVAQRRVAQEAINEYRRREETEIIEQARRDQFDEDIARNALKSVEVPTVAKIPLTPTASLVPTVEPPVTVVTPTTDPDAEIPVVMAPVTVIAPPPPEDPES